MNNKTMLFNQTCPSYNPDKTVPGTRFLVPGSQFPVPGLMLQWIPINDSRLTLQCVDALKRLSVKAEEGAGSQVLACLGLNPREAVFFLLPDSLIAYSLIAFFSTHGSRLTFCQTLNL
jgi:hypothetical protein